MVKEIALTQGQVALVDDEDFERVNKYKWCAQWFPSTKSFRASRRKLVRERGDGGQERIYLHRFVMNAPRGRDVDHVNHNTLDNRKSNLRICTRSENCMNKLKWNGCSSRFKGVSWSKEVLKWRANIKKDNKQCSLGYFTDETDAARAYNQAALRLHGDFACLNVFPDD